MSILLYRLSAAVAGCYAAVQFHLFKPSDILGDFLKCVGGNPAYVDAEYEMVFCIPFVKIFCGYPCDSSGKEIHP